MICAISLTDKVKIMIFDSCYFSIIKTLIGFVDIFNLNVFCFCFHVNFSSSISIFLLST